MQPGENGHCKNKLKLVESIQNYHISLKVCIITRKTTRTMHTTCLFDKLFHCNFVYRLLISIGLHYTKIVEKPSFIRGYFMFSPINIVFYPICSLYTEFGVSPNQHTHTHNLINSTNLLNLLPTLFGKYKHYISFGDFFLSPHCNSNILFILLTVHQNSAKKNSEIKRIFVYKWWTSELLLHTLK